MKEQYIIFVHNFEYFAVWEIPSYFSPMNYLIWIFKSIFWLHTVFIINLMIFNDENELICVLRISFRWVGFLDSAYLSLSSFSIFFCTKRLKVLTSFSWPYHHFSALPSVSIPIFVENMMENLWILRVKFWHIINYQI